MEGFSSYGNKWEENFTASRRADSPKEAFNLKVNLGDQYFKCLFA